MINTPALWANARRQLPITGNVENAVLMLHGYGSNADDLIDLAPELAEVLPHTAFISPNAPFPCEMSPVGRQWFSLQEFTPQKRWEGVNSAAPYLLQMIHDVQTEFALPLNKIALLGFSQGAMMTLHIAPRLESPIAAAIAFSGMLVGTEHLATDTKSRPPVLIVHGEIDPIVPFASLGMAERALKAENFAVKAVACPFLPHSIDRLGLDTARDFLTAAFKNTGKSA